MERNNTLTRISAFVVIIIIFLIVGLIRHYVINQTCDTQITLNDNTKIMCKSVRLGTQMVRYRTCEGDIVIVNSMDVKEIKY